MHALSLIQAGFVGHLVAAGGYLLLAFLIIGWWEYRLAGLLMAVASLATALWAAVIARDLWGASAIGPAGEILEIARSCGWLVLLASLLYWVSPVARSSWAVVITAMGILVGVLSLAHGNSSGTVSDRGGSLLFDATHLAFALVGLLLVENLFRNSPSSHFWNIKYLCIGVGALFAYDFFLYADALLFRRLSADLFLARGGTNAFVLPFLVVYAARNRKIGPTIVVSRRTVLHSATLLGAGLYLIGMAGAGYYVRQFGGQWSSFLQAVFFFGAALLLVVPLSSASSRAYLRVLIEKNFFKYKYDYRAEWLRFIETISATGSPDDLRDRVTRSVCDIMESPDGALWLESPQGKYALASSWNCSRWKIDSIDSTIDARDPLVEFFTRKYWVVDLDEFARNPERYQGLSALPQWLPSISRAWLVVPLIRHDRLFGIIVVGRPRVHRDLSWEDFDLLKTVGRHAASYLAEQAASEALVEARQFDAFNKRFAFVAHDLKNAVSQLSLIVANLARHRDNAEFQQDASETLRQSVERLNRLLRQLSTKAPGSASASAPAPVKTIALAPLLEKMVAERRTLQEAAVTLTVDSGNAVVVADEERLTAVIGHLIQNAVDAARDHGIVNIRLSDTKKMAIVEVEDNGPGMDADFVRDKLFRPFATTKGSGYGIGVYESREYAQALGGRLDVFTRPGSGTIMRVMLPICQAYDGAAGA